MLLRVLPILLLVSACASAPDGTSQREPEPARARAALATLHVDNRSPERLTISYRLTSTGRAVGIGQVPARSAAELAPVPAGEPLVLIARTTNGAELVLPARTFAIDGAWTWLIPEDARFIRSSSDAR